MQCTNCGANVPRGYGACPQCGVFARVTVSQRKRRSRTTTWILALLLIAAAIAAATYFISSRTPAKPQVLLPTRLAGGGTITEAEAMLRLQQTFEKPECIAVISNGYRDGAYQLKAVNRCDGTRLGRWRVDGKTGAVSR